VPALCFYDDQLAAYLGTFVIPLDYQTRLYEYVVASHPNPQQDTAEQRRRLETQIERLATCMCWVTSTRRAISPSATA
jgi:hypothetical protein